MNIIDAHTHFFSGKGPLDWARVEATVALAGRLDITRMCALGDVFRYGDFPTPAQISEINDTTVALVQRYPEIFWGFCFLNPSHSETFVLHEMDRCILEHGFKGIKLEVALNCRDNKLDPLMTRARELDVPVLHHSWYKTVGADRHPQESAPSDIADLASRFPDVKIIMAHLTGGGMRGVQDIQPFPNVYIDTSGGQPVAGMIEYAIEKLGPGRILYGSDVPCRDFASQLGRIYGTRLSKRNREMILYRNTRDLLDS